MEASNDANRSNAWEEKVFQSGKNYLDSGTNDLIIGVLLEHEAGAKTGLSLLSPKDVRSLRTKAG